MPPWNRAAFFVIEKVLGKGTKKPYEFLSIKPVAARTTCQRQAKFRQVAAT